MAKIKKAARRTAKPGINAADHPGSPQFQAGGKPIVCSHCGSKSFAFVGAAAMSYAGYGIECSNCTHIEYFGKKPEHK